MAITQQSSPSQPAAGFGLTLLLVALTFALPFTLVPKDNILIVSPHMSNEVANVYACTAWAGWAHFWFAFRGQGQTLGRFRDQLRTKRILTYLAGLAIAIAILIGLRSYFGIAAFGAVVWVYFIDHFIKAEQAFEGQLRTDEPSLRRWLRSYQVLLSFGWLTVVLMNMGNVIAFPWTLWVVSLALAAVVLGVGGWRNLTQGDVRGPLLSLFFIAEALVWGTFGRYGGPAFLTGVYIFHIAAGSYFHYLGSYFFAGSKTPTSASLRFVGTVLAVNIIVIGLGFFATNVGAMSWLRPILGIEWFTLWVAVHLVASDIFPAIKAWRIG